MPIDEEDKYAGGKSVRRSRSGRVGARSLGHTQSAWAEPGGGMKMRYVHATYELTNNLL